jgi:hypothetical protein
MFRNSLPGNDSFAAISCKGNVISSSLLNSGRLTLALLLWLSAFTSQYYLLDYDVVLQTGIWVAVY